MKKYLTKYDNHKFKLIVKDLKEIKFNKFSKILITAKEINSEKEYMLEAYGKVIKYIKEFKKGEEIVIYGKKLNNNRIAIEFCENGKLGKYWDN